jgi:hypothetical protein
MPLRGNNLPFARGTTFSDGGGIGMTVSDESLDHMLGAEFVVADTVHELGGEVVLRLLKNDADTALTMANNVYKFGTDAYDYGRKVDALTDTAGQACIPIDDAYATGFSIPSKDYFWGVVRGPCNIRTEAGAITHAVHSEVICDDLGCLYGGTMTAGQFVIGTVDQGGSTSDTAVLVWVDLWLGGIKGS